MRCTLKISAGFLQNIGSGKNNFFTSLWSKPQSRDERIKEYVPEVIDESLQEQRALLEESTSRDIIVELGHKVLRELENKSPTPSIAPHLNKILEEYGSKDIIAQRPLSYLLYPSSVMSGGKQPNDLIMNFTDNFRALVDEVERNGCSARTKVTEHGKKEAVPRKKASESYTETPSADSKSGPVIMTSPDDHEPADITYFIRVLSAMSLANVQHGDWNNAVRCVDAAIIHAVEPSRLGGLLGMKAGILVHQRKYEEAMEYAKLAVETSGNIQGYIHGAFALRMLRQPSEAVHLLEKGREEHPMNMQIAAQMQEAQNEVGQLEDDKKMISS